MSAADLTSRVTAILGGQGGASDAETLQADLRSEIAGLEPERASAQAASLDVTTPAAAAAKHNARAAQLAFEVERLTRQAEAVGERYDALQAEDADRKADAQREAAEEERDQLAVDLARDYPAAVSVIVDLLDRVAVSDRRLQAVGINPVAHGAETRARGFAPGVAGLPGPLGGALRLADLRGRDAELLWPRREVFWTAPPVATYAPAPPPKPRPGARRFEDAMAQATAQAAADAVRFPVDVTPARIPLG